MIQRLHLEEAQQPSAYAISAARESGEYRDDKENESLAFEFQSLLAQISGQIATATDQAMVVGLALAQTAAPQQQRRDREAKLDDDVGEQQDLLSQQDTKTRDFGVDNSQRNFELRGDKQSDEDEAGDEKQDGRQSKNDQVVTNEIADVVSTQEEVVEAVEQVLVKEAATTFDLGASDASDVQVVAQGPVKDTGEQLQVATYDTTQQDSSVQVESQDHEQAQIDLKQARVSVKQEKSDESTQEDELAQTVASTVENSQRDSDISLKSKKNEYSEAKHKDVSDASHGVQKSDQTNGGSDLSGRNQSQKHPFDERRELQDLELSSRAQKLADGANKGTKTIKESNLGESVETFAAPVTRTADRATDGSSFQMTILRQSFDALKMNRVDDRAAKPQATGVTAANANTETKSAQNEQSSRASKTLTRPQTAKMLERVEATLKEAARSRDGRTISLHLEPVNLGKVKVDVSLREGVLHARIAPENQQVMTALREHAHELQSSLRKLGLDVESVSVSVTSDSFEGEMNTGQQMSDGRSFQDERNKMPRDKAQLAENTVGNELAQHTSAGAETRGSATRNELDHWVA